MWQSIVLVLVVNIVYTRGQTSCTTPNGEKARCVLLQSCPNFKRVVYETEPDAEQIKFLRASVCEYEGQTPIVCCGSHTRYNNLLPDRSQCGIQDSLKILGGENTDPTEFPWLALVEHTKVDGSGSSFGCGGSLINKRYVLTAAHCVVSRNYKVTKVRLGEWNLDTTEDCVGAGVHKSCSPPPQDIEVEDAISHDEFSNIKDGVFNDIALLRLKREAELNDFVQPICLPLPTERSNIGDRLYVSGWGAVSPTQIKSSIKQKLLIPVVDHNTCKAKFGGSGKTINSKMICAGGEKGKDSCKGDSGGPLIAQATNNTSQYYIEGIVSYGAICGSEGWPGVYTKVSEYVDWIRQNMKP